MSARVGRYVFTEDTYGVDFHRIIIDHLYNNGLLSGVKPVVRRMPSKKCNLALARKVKQYLSALEWLLSNS